MRQGTVRKIVRVRLCSVRLGRRRGRAAVHRVRAGLGIEVPRDHPAVALSTEQFIPFLAFPPEIRKIVYMTNAIESLNSRFRQACRRGHFPDENSALKVLYPVIQNPQKNRANVTGGTPGWKEAIDALTMYYGERITFN